MITSFELHALPAGRVVSVTRAVRIGHGGTLMAGADGRVYYSNLTRDKIYSHRLHIPERVLVGLVEIGAISTGDGDAYRAAVKLADDARRAYYDLETLERLARERGVMLDESPTLDALRNLAALHDTDSY